MRNKKRKICGVGVNDYEGVIRSQGEIMYEYVVWSDMIRRCYSVKERSRLPTYAGYQAEPYFHYFTNFLNFIKTLKGFNQRDEKGKVFEMDKDLLIKGNTIYSRSSICFLPSDVNKFLTKSNRSRGKYPIGVSYHKSVCKYVASINLEGKLKHLGCFNDQYEAFHAYKLAKEAAAKRLAEKYKNSIDQRAFDALLNFVVEETD